jgi:hypothetical protein
MGRLQTRGSKGLRAVTSRSVLERPLWAAEGSSRRIAFQFDAVCPCLGSRCSLSHSQLAAHIDRPAPVLRLCDELRYGLHFRKGRSADNDKALKINTLFKPSFRGPRAVG